MGAKTGRYVGPLKTQGALGQSLTCLLFLFIYFLVPLSILGALQLFNISKRKVDADSPFISPCSCNLTFKGGGKGLAALVF
jgi:hypothetical protein